MAFFGPAFPGAALAAVLACVFASFFGGGLSAFRAVLSAFAAFSAVVGALSAIYSISAAPESKL